MWKIRERATRISVDLAIRECRALLLVAKKRIGGMSILETTLAVR